MKEERKKVTSEGLNKKKRRMYRRMKAVEEQEGRKNGIKPQRCEIKRKKRKRKGGKIKEKSGVRMKEGGNKRRMDEKEKQTMSERSRTQSLDSSRS